MITSTIMQRRQPTLHPYSLAIALLVLSVHNYVSVEAQDRQIVCPKVQSVDSSIDLQVSDPNKVDFTEISGLGFSPTLTGPSGKPLIYVINDGGGGRRFGIYDSGTGIRLLSLRMPRSLTLALDWESISVGSCGGANASSSCIYIADVGDNVALDTGGTRTQHKERPGYPLYKVKEPNYVDFADNDVLPESYVTTLWFNYYHATSPTRYSDCEATLVDSVGWGQDGAPGDLYIVTKWGWNSGLTRLFKIPARIWSQAKADGSFVYSPRAVGNYSAINGLSGVTWTRAESTLDGTVIALGTYYDQYLFLRCPGMTVADALAVPGTQYCETWPIAYWDSQFETIAWTPDGSSTLEISECYGNSCDPNVPMVFTKMNYTYDPQTSWYCEEVGPTKAPSPSAAPNTPCASTLNATEMLYSNQEPSFICSPNGEYRFGIDASNSDLALWQQETKIWSAGTANCCGDNEVFLIMQGTDGNLVLREDVIRDGQEQRLVLWMSQTNNTQREGAFLSIKNDGVARIIWNETELWSTTADDSTVSGSASVTDAPTRAPTPFSCSIYERKEPCKDDKRCNWKKGECIND